MEQDTTAEGTLPQRLAELIEPGRAPTRRDQLISELGYSIVSGERPAGSLLYINEIAQDSSCSYSVVREALSVLATLGLVESRKRRGTMIRSEQYWAGGSLPVIAWRLRDPKQRAAQFQHLVEARRAIEPAAAALAAVRRSGQVAARISDLANELLASAQLNDLERFLEADVQFHRVILTAGKNPLLSSFSAQIDIVLEARHYYDYMPPQPNFHALRHHRDVAHAIAQGDQVRARNSAQAIVDQADGEFLQSVANSARPEVQPDTPPAL